MSAVALVVIFNGCGEFEFCNGSGIWVVGALNSLIQDGSSLDHGGDMWLS